MQKPICPHCNISMEEGLPIMENSFKSTRQGFFSAPIPVTPYACLTCGYVVSYLKPEHLEKLKNKIQ